MNIIATTTLWNHKNGSDKIYTPAIVENPAGGYDVIAQNGPRGGTQSPQAPKKVGVDLASAQKAYEALVKSKIKGGYEPMDGDPIAVAAASERDGKSENVPVMLLDVIHKSELATKLADTAWMFQQKHDGHRRLIVTSATEAHGVNRKGESVPLSTAIAELAFAVFGPNAIVDGEQVGEIFWAFDLLKIGGNDFTNKPAELRHRTLGEYVNARSLHAISFVENITDIEKLRLTGAEGVVGKLRSSKYRDGKKHGVAVKYKFWHSATVQVIRKNDAHSVGIGLYDAHRILVDVGNVTLPPSMKAPEIGALVEVRYLYAYHGGSLYQPTFLTGRTDVDRDDCTIDQLSYKGKQ